MWHFIAPPRVLGTGNVTLWDGYSLPLTQPSPPLHNTPTTPSWKLPSQGGQHIPTASLAVVSMDFTIKQYHFSQLLFIASTLLHCLLQAKYGPWMKSPSISTSLTPEIRTKVNNKILSRYGISLQVGWKLTMICPSWTLSMLLPIREVSITSNSTRSQTFHNIQKKVAKTSSVLTPSLLSSCQYNYDLIPAGEQPWMIWVQDQERGYYCHLKHYLQSNMP